VRTLCSTFEPGRARLPVAPKVDILQHSRHDWKVVPFAKTVLVNRHLGSITDEFPETSHAYRRPQFIVATVRGVDEELGFVDQVAA
jgi:hypothetical protein